MVKKLALMSGQLPLFICPIREGLSTLRLSRLGGWHCVSYDDEFLRREPNLVVVHH
jgi:hypothetical protein